MHESERPVANTGITMGMEGTRNDPPRPTADMLSGALAGIAHFRDRQIGDLAVARGLITSHQLEDCLRTGTETPLDEFLVARGLISEKQRQGLLQDPGLHAVPLSGSVAVPTDVAAAQALPGRMLDHHVLVEEIGHGGMGIVWKAWDLKLNRWVAVKEVRDESGPGIRSRFLREVHAAAKFRHPNLVTIHSAGESEGRLYLVMDLVRGKPIDLQGPRDATIDRLRKIAGALEEAHRHGVVHRDLKPGNILVDERGEPVVVDFGLAQLADGRTQLTRAGAAIGTPAYMSPEQVKGDASAIGPSSDIYAIGVMLYEMLADQPPHAGINAEEVFAHILNVDPPPPGGPEDLVTICTKAMSREPSRRYSSAEALARDLQRFQAGEPISARPESRLYRWKRRIQKHRGLVAGGALLFAALAMGILLVTNRSDRRESPHLESGRGMMRRLLTLLTTADPKFETVVSLRDQAASEFTLALEETPKSSEALLELGRCHRVIEGRSEQAIDCFTKALDADPRNARAGFERAMVRLDAYSVAAPDRRIALGVEIEKDLRRVRKEPSLAAEASLADGTLLLLDGKYSKAAKVLTDYARAAISDPQGWALAGRALLEDERPSEAIGAFDQALQLRPYHAYFRFNRGVALAKLGKTDAALQDYTAAIARKHNFSDAYSNRAGILLDSGNAAAALRDCEQAIRHQPELPDAFYNRGNARNALGDPDGAIADFTEAIRLKNTYYEALYNRALTNGAGGKWDSALADFKEVVRLKPDFAQGHFGVGTALQETGKVRDSLAELTAAIELKADYWEALVNRGNTYLKLKHHPESARDFTTATRIHPDRAEAWIGRGNARAALKEFKDAILDLEQALKLLPANDGRRADLEALIENIKSRIPK